MFYSSIRKSRQKTEDPNKKIVILADEYKDIHQWIKPTGYPCINMVDQDMKLITFTGRGLTEAFDILSNLK